MHFYIRITSYKFTHTLIHILSRIHILPHRLSVRLSLSHIHTFLNFRFLSLSLYHWKTEIHSHIHTPFSLKYIFFPPPSYTYTFTHKLSLSLSLFFLSQTYTLINALSLFTKYTRTLTRIQILSHSVTRCVLVDFLPWFRWIDKKER